MRAWLSSVVLAVVLPACGVGTRQPIAGPPIEQVLRARPRLLWVAAHPDDESVGGGLLGRACIADGALCHFLVFNRGAGGECALSDCKPDLGSVRHRELTSAARMYHATLEHYDLYNAPLPVESFPSRHELERRWMSDSDPAGLVARAVRRFRPDVVVTLDPYHGFTGHPEHQAAARFALAGIRLAADAAAADAYVAGEPPYRVGIVYNVQNQHWFMALAGDGKDPMPWNEALLAGAGCAVRGASRRCIDVAMDNSHAHRSQQHDLDGLRAMLPFWETSYVRRLDPFGREASDLVAELAPGSKR